MRKIFLLLLVFVLFIILGCSCKSENSENLITDSQEKISDKTTFDQKKELEAFFLDASNSSMVSSNMIYHKFPHAISRMEIGENLSLNILDMEVDGKDIYRFYDEQGEFSKELDDNYGFIYYCRKDKVFYVYNVTFGRIDEVDLNFEYKRTVLNDFHPFEIKEMMIKNNDLYVLYVQENPYNKNEEDIFENEKGYSDYGETIVRVSLSGNDSKEIHIPGLVTMCDNGNDYIYLYVYRDDAYYIDVYDTLSEKVVVSVEVTEAGYVFAFSIIGKTMYYYSAGTSGLYSLNLENKENKLVISGYMALLQSDMESNGNQLICYDRRRWEVFTIDTVTGQISGDEGETRKTNDECDVVIGAIGLPFDPANVSDITDLSVGGYESLIYADEDFQQQLMFKLMAGDDDIDIYMFYSSDPAIKRLSNDGVCLDLSESEKLLDENKKLFKNISDHFKTDSGAIWGVPLSSYIPVIIYYENNLRNKGISKDDFRSFSSLMDRLRQLNDTDGIYVFGSDYGNWLLANYITNSKNPDFNAPLFREYFEQMWDGWMVGAEYGLQNHPLLGKGGLVKVVENGIEQSLGAADNAWIVDTDTTVFHMVGINDVINREKLREGTSIISLPLISDEFKQSITIPLVAIVNPNGKNKEKAVRFLEDYVEYIRKNGIGGVMYNDTEDYPEHYYTDTDTFRDIFAICKDALVMDHGMANDYYYHEIAEYQRKMIDLETAVKSMQRKEDAYRNE